MKMCAIVCLFFFKSEQIKFRREKRNENKRRKKTNKKSRNTSNLMASSRGEVCKKKAIKPVMRMFQIYISHGSQYILLFDENVSCFHRYRFLLYCRNRQERATSNMQNIMGFFRRPKTSTSSSKSGGGDEDAPMCIGEPFNVKRNYHVGFNKEKGEFEGLPESWEQLLNNSNIS